METRQLANIEKKESIFSRVIGKTQIIRHICQILGFWLMPGLFIAVLNAFKGLWQALLGGSFTWAAMGAPLLVLLAVIPVTALWGRFFCGYLCAFGSMQEFAAFLAKKLHLPQLKIAPAADHVMRNIKYGVLAVLFVLWTFSISYDFISPWSVFGQYVHYKGWSDLSHWFSVGGQFLIAILLVSLFVERGFCRYACPLGGAFSLISRGRLFKVKGGSHCAGCGKCDAACPMGISVSAEAGGAIPGGSVTSPECIDCFRCVESCGAKALYTSPREALAGSAAAFAIAGVYQLGTITVSSPIAGMTSLSAVSQTASQGTYTDGTYEGSGQGYRGEIKVKVTVSGGSITSIDVESHSDDSDFFNRAKNTVISEILAEQTTDVQTVSGATYSSRGIMQAVANALGVTAQESAESDTLPGGFSGRHRGFGGEGAGEHGGRRRPGSSEDNGSENNNEGHHRRNRPGSDSGGNSTSDNEKGQKGNNSENKSESYDFKDLKDGTYTGSGQGRNGSIDVTVKVKKGKVTSITIESSREDARYMNQAKDTVISEIIDAQSLNVPTVSGATMSSNGILRAVADALGIEFTSSDSRTGGRGGRSSI